GLPKHRSVVWTEKRPSALSCFVENASRGPVRCCCSLFQSDGSNFGQQGFRRNAQPLCHARLVPLAVAKRALEENALNVTSGALRDFLQRAFPTEFFRQQSVRQALEIRFG